ncbi:MAG: mannose-1-phosphate guanylyltransferase [candidate division Zixibacteria bacterium]|nr:mannose-1-phosphate guanylyltransferase [candidate division Zixibacteria bacterium]
MAGGRGERFWPLSNQHRPKQLLSLTEDRSMLCVTIDRLEGYIPAERTVVVAGKNIEQAIIDGCCLVKKEMLLCEPFGRNTCLAIGYTAVHLQKRDPNAIMVVLSADHLIEPAKMLTKTIKAGVKIAAEQDKLITIGIVPSRAETGYGYIELSDEKWVVDGITVCNVSAFKEKPRPTVAQEYYHGRRHLWNSGMFIWSINSILSAFEKHMPEMHQELMEYAKTIGTPGEEAACQKLYEEAESISIDFAILEQADNVITLKGSFSWDDVGSWMALQRFMDVDKDNNVIIGNAVTMDTFESTIVNDGKGIIAAIGLSDIVVVRTGETIMVAHKTQLGKIKDLLAKMGADESQKKYL